MYSICVVVRYALLLLYCSVAVDSGAVELHFIGWKNCTKRYRLLSYVLFLAQLKSLVKNREGDGRTVVSQH